LGNIIRKPIWLLAAAVALAGSAGYFAAVAIGIGQQAPTTTVTVNIPTGETGPKGDTGPAGPPGPKGDPGSPGAESCPTGSTFQAVKFNAPGGQTTIWTCVAS